MIQVEDKLNIFKDKNIVVVGLARSGTGAANLLSSLGAGVTITDSKSGNSLATYIEKLLPSVKVVTGGNPPEIFDSADMVVISPGVPSTAPALERARVKGIPVIGELELAYQVIRGKRQEAKGKGQKPAFIGITGTNGKSTTTMLVDLMMKEAGFKTLLGGNIGIALTEEILKKGARGKGQGVGEEDMSPDYVVAEISSFQLETIHEFRPQVAAILNITPDHLDRYKNMEEYVDAKVRIFENQTREDFLVLNADDPELEKVRSEKLEVGSKELPETIYFSRRKEVKGVYLKEGMIYCNLSHVSLPTSHFPLISQNEIKIQGVHNVENAMAASLTALIAGCPPESIINVLRDFPGLEHRLEFAGEVNGIRFINDSKGTNVGAVLKSLEGFDNVILIMGGLDKGSDFSLLKDLVRQRVKALILIGKAKDRIAEALGGITETLIADDLQAAVDLSLSKASAGDTVLLSPGCASFDMFQDFEDRGRKFKETVRLAGATRRVARTEKINDKH
ncbi:MAG: UDP-N-acetylmuramoyl-L-alanine--D-glutamate ligase [Nitrospiraceae bacterium]|nr:MAG: UDP-N-acetylmuramoyl-L-alanine--D-glutamate ligase [Nitrospiraceae bacterium]